MSVFQACSDTSDAIPFSPSHSLYLKPVARVTVSVQLPGLKQPGKSISNWEVMEKLRHYAMPEEFINLKVSKSTLEVVRFEGEIENCSKIPAVLARLDGRSIKLSGFPESLKVRAAIAKPDFPNRHSWDSYFRDAKNMNEMKPGERPDTIYIANLPCKWFSTKSDASKPSEYILRKIFEAFGEIRCVDIPMLDPFRSQMKSHISGIKMFSNNQNMIFEAYIQFKEYVCFVKIMDTLRGMKLLHKDPDGRKAFCASIKVDFDKTKHMSESSIRRRRIEREKLMAKEREREDQERLAREEEERKLAEERKRVEAEREAALERRRQREERRKTKRLERLKQEEADEMNRKIETEERLLLRAQRRLESFRLLGELFNRLKIAKETERDKYKNPESYRKHRDRNKNQDVDQLAARFDIKEKELRDKLVKKFKLSDQSSAKPKERHHVAENDEAEFPSDGYQDFMDERGCGRGMQRGARGNWSRRRRGNMPFRGNQSFRGNQFPQMAFPSFPNRGGYFPTRGGFPRWPAFPPRGRGGGMEAGFFPPPFIDPFYLDSAMSDPYYKYFRNITLGNKRSRKSRSRSRSRSRSYSKSYSRSRSRSFSRSQSRSRSRSSHSRNRRSRSNSHGRRRSRTRSRSKSRSRRRSRSRSERRKYSRNKSNSPKYSKIDSNKLKDAPEKPVIFNQDTEGSAMKASSVHTWSRSPSRERSLSWEKQKDDASSTKLHKHKKEKKKKDKKEKKKKKKIDTE